LIVSVISGKLPRRDNRLYLIDKNLNVISYSLHLSIINYQTCIIRGDLAAAEKIFTNIPKEHYNKIAQFLEALGHKEKALEITNDADHKFELAIQLDKLEIAYAIAKELQSEHKWKQIGDLALSAFKFDLAEECLKFAQDFSGLLLLYSSTGSEESLLQLAQVATQQGKNNIAFICYFLTQKIEACLDLLCKSGRIPEAAFLARTYLPSHVSSLVKLWREDLQTINQKAAESLADPMEYGNLFPDLVWALKIEQILNPRRTNLFPAAFYSEYKDDISRDLISELKKLGTLPRLGSLPEKTEAVESHVEINAHQTDEPISKQIHETSKEVANNIEPDIPVVTTPVVETLPVISIPVVITPVVSTPVVSIPVVSTPIVNELAVEDDLDDSLRAWEEDALSIDKK